MRISLNGYCDHQNFISGMSLSFIFTIGAHALKVDCLTPKMTRLEMTKQMKIRFYKSNNLMRKHLRKPGR